MWLCLFSLRTKLKSTVGKSQTNVTLPLLIEDKFQKHSGGKSNKCDFASSHWGPNWKAQWGKVKQMWLCLFSLRTKLKSTVGKSQTNVTLPLLIEDKFQKHSGGKSNKCDFASSHWGPNWKAQWGNVKQMWLCLLVHWAWAPASVMRIGSCGFIYVYWAAPRVTGTEPLRRSVEEHRAQSLHSRRVSVSWRKK